MNIKNINFHLEDLSRLARWLFSPLLKLTAHSKHPTNPDLDELKRQMAWYLRPVIENFKHLIIEQFKWFFKYRWKRLLRNYIIIITSCYLIYRGVDYSIDHFIKPHFTMFKFKPVKTDTLVIFRANLKSWEEFKLEVRIAESGNNYKCVSKFGMLGAYGFDPNTLKDYVGINVSKEEFLNNPELQDGAFKVFIRKNRKNFEHIIERWNYRKIKNVKGTVTESGILMAYHLKPIDAKVFFESNGENLGVPDKNGKIGDANQTTVNKYIEKFSGAEIPF